MTVSQIQALIDAVTNGAIVEFAFSNEYVFDELLRLYSQC